jgi:2-polyprenyl-3-methyl-5-hydroxy-6-metoxy-1,4-benzoquinol methylase
MPTTNVIEKNCDLCGSAKKRLIREENGYPISECVDCSLVYVNQIPTVENGKVVGEYYSGDDAEIENNRHRYAEVSRYLVDEINRLRPEKGKLMDVGCGYGFFLMEAKKSGWDVYGTDLSDISIDYIRKNHGLENVWCADLPDVELPDGALSAINMTNVLEHVPFPTKTLQECQKLLDDDGILLVRVPNMTFSRVIEFFRPALKFVKVLTADDISYLATMPPIHLTGFSPKTLDQYFAKTGFETVEIKPSKLSTMTERSAAFGLFEKFVNVIFKASFGRINISPTILAVARKVK